MVIVKPMKTEASLWITTARFKNFSIYRPSCMNAYKNSIREYGWLSALSDRQEGAEVNAEGMLPILDLRLEYLIDSVLLAHACTSNRGCAFHETLLVDDAVCSSVLFLFFFFRGASYFSKRVAHDHLVVISDEIEKG